MTERSRLIPAHAGKTLPCSPRRSPARAHPRSRGENLVTTGSYDGNLGSSPLTRGKLRERIFHVVKPGLIPAHAGKTWSCPSRNARPWAHPRSRGENAGGRVSRVGARGSSPLTRGKRGTPKPSPRGCGLIPAHAGKTGTGAGEVVTLGAHPRSRGENSCACVVRGERQGSSPLTRGKLKPVDDRANRALAHPRSRGENRVLYGSLSDVQGSSPLTRGKREDHTPRA